LTAWSGNRVLECRTRGAAVACAAMTRLSATILLLCMVRHGNPQVRGKY
jgi:hypothetical protein